MILAVLAVLAIPELVGADQDETVIPPRRTGRPHHRRGRPSISGSWCNRWWRKGWSATKTMPDWSTRRCLRQLGQGTAGWGSGRRSITIPSRGAGA